MGIFHAKRGKEKAAIVPKAAVKVYFYYLAGKFLQQKGLLKIDTLEDKKFALDFCHIKVNFILLREIRNFCLNKVKYKLIYRQFCLQVR